MIDLSILICSTDTRAATFGQAIQAQVWPQYRALPAGDRDRIEILMLTDNKTSVLGDKRNNMLRLAQGRYVLFIDDDDRIEPDLFATLLEATTRNTDVVTFQVSVTLDGGPPKLCRYSKNFPGDSNLADQYQRWPNHLCMIRRDLAIAAGFPTQNCGEDSVFAQRLHPMLKTEHMINRVLYHYDFSSHSTETQFRPAADIVILSNATNDQLRHYTQNTIDTARAGTNKPVTVTVLEQQPGIGYHNADTHHMPQKFNYNQFANYGAQLGSADWIVIANNDLHFYGGWLEHLLAANHPLVSPKCRNDRRQTNVFVNTVGDINGKHFSGWCFMIARQLWKRIGGFDDCVSFWCSDDVVIAQAKQLDVTPMLVPNAQVDHLRSQTLNTTPQRDDLTWAQLDIYINKYGPHPLQHDHRYLTWKQCSA